MTTPITPITPTTPTSHHPATRRAQRFGALLMLLAHLSGCAAPSSGPYAPRTETQRDTAGSERLAHEAAAVLDTNPAKAETLLRDALTADLYNGPAHNNLGVLYLKAGKLYEAAGEFEWARKMMPGAPDPRLNLALTLERAGRTNEALDTYRTALEVYPGHIRTIEALARLQIRSDKIDHQTPDYLREIALRGETERWKEWARVQQARPLSGSPGSFP